MGVLKKLLYFLILFLIFSLFGLPTITKILAVFVKNLAELGKLSYNYTTSV